MVKNLPAGDLGSIPRLGRSPGEGNGYPLQYSCLENPMNRGDWHATVHGVIKSQTQLNNFHYEHSFLVQVMILSIGHSCTISRLCVCVQMLSHVQLFVTSWNIAYQASLSMGFSRREYWSGLPFPPPGIFLIQGSNLHLLCLLHCRRVLYLLSHWKSPSI